MEFGNILILILCKTGKSGLKITYDTVQGQQGGKGWATAVKVMNKKGMIVLGQWLLMVTLDVICFV